MNNKPLVSIIMNCYNSDKYLNDAIDSILNQSYINWEIIFWDNQSIDRSAEIINSYADGRIKYFYASTFTSLGKARNLAIEKCNGEWIGFLDCDDLWDSKKLEIYIESLNNDSKCTSLIYSNTIFIDSHGKYRGETKKTISGYICNELLFYGNFIVFSSILINRKILTQTDKINENLDFCEDYDLLLKITKGYNSIGIDKLLTSYRQHNGNITSRKTFENSVETIEYLTKYLEYNKLSAYSRFRIKCNISYFLFISLTKELKKFNLLNFVKLSYIYKTLMFLIPIAVINKLMKIVK